MAVISRHRVIRPSSRKTSSPYKVKTDNVMTGDVLEVLITHESEAFSRTFKFSGSEVAGKKSISFKALKNNGSWDINWYGVSRT